MQIESIEIVGTVLTVVMGINGFFLKGVYSDMQFLKVELAKLITKHDNVASDASENSKEIYRLRERVHALEGAQSQIISFIEEHGKR